MKNPDGTLPSTDALDDRNDRIAEASRSGQHAFVVTPDGEREKQKLSLAPVFDRLVESNLELSQVVKHFVRVQVTLTAVYGIGFLLLAIAIVATRR